MYPDYSVGIASAVAWQDETELSHVLTTHTTKCKRRGHWPSSILTCLIYVRKLRRSRLLLLMLLLSLRQLLLLWLMLLSSLLRRWNTKGLSSYMSLWWPMVNFFPHLRSVLSIYFSVACLSSRKLVWWWSRHTWWWRSLSQISMRLSWRIAS